MKLSVIAVARLFLFVREIPGNHGARVNAIQTWGGGTDGDSWCCWLVTMVLDLYFQGKSPIPRTGSCDAVYRLAKKNGWLRDTPEIGDLYLFVNGEDAHHIGFVTETEAPAERLFNGLSGNTSEDGESSNGTCVAEHWLNVVQGKTVFVRYPR